MNGEHSQLKENLGKLIKKEARFYEDFPKKGVTFMDLFSLTSKPEIFSQLMEGTEQVIKNEIGEPGKSFNVIVGLESRGFI